MVVVLITTASCGLRSHVELEPEGSGLNRTSYARCDQLRVVSVERLSSRQRMSAQTRSGPLTKHRALSSILCDRGLLTAEQKALCALKMVGAQCITGNPPYSTLPYCFPIRSSASGRCGRAERY